MARTCPLCGLSPREGDVMRPVRLSTEAQLEVTPHANELGLYAGCGECQDKLRKVGSGALPEKGQSQTMAIDGG